MEITDQEEELSGSIVSFNGRNNTKIKSLVVNIEPIQEGTGDPSPDNDRPISGWTGATIYQLAGLPSGYKVADYVEIRDGFTIPTTIDFNAQDVEVICTFRPVYYKQYASLYKVYLNENAVATRIIFGSSIDSLYINNNSKASSPTGITIDSNVFNTIRNCYGKCYLNGQEISISTTAGNRTNSDFSVGQASSYWDIKGIAVYKNGAKLLNLIPCINSGGVAGFYESVSKQFYTTPTPSFATAYGNFSGIDYLNTYSIPINWQTEAGTVYGGTVTLNKDGSADVVANYGTDTYNGSETWVKSGDLYYTVNTSIKRSKTYSQTMRCNIFAVANYNGKLNYTNFPNGGVSGLIDSSSYLGQNWLYVLPLSGTATVADFKTWLSEHNLQVVYELSTPQTYHFTNIGQLYTFLGANNVWANIGDITVKIAEKGITAFELEPHI